MPKKIENSAAGPAIRRDATTGRYVALPPSPADRTYTDPELAKDVEKLVRRITRYKARLRDAS